MHWGPMLAVLAAALAGGASATSPAALYDAAAIYRMSFHGIALGMTHRDVCERLIAAGYRRWQNPQARCEPGVLAEDEDGFNGGSRAMGLPAEHVSFIAMDFDAPGPEGKVLRLYSLTMERGSTAQLMQLTREQFGPATDQWEDGGAVSPIRVRLGYGATMHGVQPEAQDALSACQLNPPCAWREGIDCRAVAQAARPYARIHVQPGGRWIEIEDPRPQFAAMRAAGKLARPRRMPSHDQCVPPPLD